MTACCTGAGSGEKPLLEGAHPADSEGGEDAKHGRSRSTGDGLVDLIKDEWNAELGQDENEDLQRT